MIEDKFNPEIIEQMKTVIIGRYSSTKTMNAAMKRFGIRASVKYSVKVCDSEKDHGKKMDSNTVIYGDKDSMTTIELCSINKHYFLNFDIDNHLYNHVLLKCGFKKTGKTEHPSMFNLITKLYRLTKNYHAEQTDEIVSEDERFEPYYDEPDVIEPFIRITLMDGKVLTSSLHQHVDKIYKPNKFTNMKAHTKKTYSNTHQKVERLKKKLEEFKKKQKNNETDFETMKNKNKKFNKITKKEGLGDKAWKKLKQIEQTTQLRENYIKQLNKIKELSDTDLICNNIKLNEKINDKNVFYVDFECFAKDVHKSYGACMVKRGESKIETFIGKNVVTQILELLPDKSLIYAHNLGYDGRIILSELPENELKIKHCITKGSLMYELEINYNNKTLIFRDSMAMIASKLKNFPAMFGEAYGKDFKIRKEVYPYQYYNKKNLKHFNTKTLGDIKEACRFIADKKIVQIYDKIDELKNFNIQDLVRILIKEKINDLKVIFGKTSMVKICNQ